MMVCDILSCFALHLSLLFTVRKQLEIMATVSFCGGGGGGKIGFHLKDKTIIFACKALFSVENC